MNTLDRAAPGRAVRSALVGLFILVAGAARAAEPLAQVQVKAAMAAMGGRERLLAIHSLRLDLRVVGYRVDDSERADGPDWLTVSTGQEWRDEATGRYRLETEDASAQWTTLHVRIGDGQMVADGGRWRGVWSWSGQPTLGDRLALSPERILFTAESAGDLRTAPDAVLFGKPQDVLAFSWKGFATRLYLDKVLHLPTRLEMLRASPLERASTMLGDIAWRTDFLVYKPQPGGVIYPFQWNLFRDGRAVSTTVVTRWDANASAPDGGYAPPADAHLDRAAVLASRYDAQPIPTPAGGDPLQSLGQDVWLIAGAWNVLVVKQPDGLVVIECPQSSGYSERVLALLTQRFPDQRVKAVVSTTDSLWHIAGVRPYVARGAPIYALDLNVPRLRTLIANRRTLVPDELAKRPRPPIFRPVIDRLDIGTGPTRIELYPIRGHGDERMMMAFLPSLGLLYGSSNDLSAEPAQPTFNAFEIVARVEDLKLPVRDYVAIHTPKIPWPKFRAVVAEQPVLSGT